MNPRELSLADIATAPIICTGRMSAAITRCLLEARHSGDAGRPLPDVACQSHEMMRHIAGATDHVLLSTLAANATALAAGDLVALPLVEPRIRVAFAILRLQARTLPPVAEELMREIVAADRATLKAERELAAGAPAPR